MLKRMTAGYDVQNFDGFGNLELIGNGGPKIKSNYEDLSLTNCNKRPERPYPALLYSEKG